MSKLVKQLVFCAAVILPWGVSGAARAEKHPTNACGCYGELNACFCERKAKCGCPGECEPKGCEEERQKRLQKEIAEETKKAKEAEKAQEDKVKAKDEGSSAKGGEGDDSDTASADKDKGRAGKGGRKMTATQKKQLQKLIDAFMAEYPESGRWALEDVRKEL